MTIETPAIIFTAVFLVNLFLVCCANIISSCVKHPIFISVLVATISSLPFLVVAIIEGLK